MRRIADSYQVQTAGNLLVGFKYIGGEMDRRGPADFVFGAEESYGFLAGDHVRDKDGAVAAMLLAELAARLKADGRTLFEQLDVLFRRHGCHAESQLSVQMPGEQGMDDMKALMAGFRSHPPAAIAGMDVIQVRDYLQRHRGRAGRPAPAARWTGRRPDLFRFAARGQLCGRAAVGDGAQGEVLHVRLRPARGRADLAATKAAQADRLARWRPTCGRSRGCDGGKVRRLPAPGRLTFAAGAAGRRRAARPRPRRSNRRRSQTA